MYLLITLSLLATLVSNVAIDESFNTNFSLAPSNSTKSLAALTNTGCANGNGFVDAQGNPMLVQVPVYETQPNMVTQTARISVILLGIPYIPNTITSSQLQEVIS